MNLSILTLIVLFLFSSTLLRSQKSLDNVVKINSVNAIGEEIGAGIVVGRRGSQIFIVTAYHIVEDATKINVTLFDAQWRIYQGKLHNRIADELDLAILTVEVPIQDNINFNQLSLASFEKIAPDDEVQVLGHPNGKGWDLNSQNKITDPNFGIFQIGFSSIGIESGYSGGLLMARKKDQLLWNGYSGNCSQSYCHSIR